jgi:hypothetical protein
MIHRLIQSPARKGTGLFSLREFNKGRCWHAPRTDKEAAVADKGERDLKFLGFAVFGIVMGIIIIVYSLYGRP